MAFAGRLTTKPRTATEHYALWFENLPPEEQLAVQDALHDRGWRNVPLKKQLESDPDYPAPKFGETAFRQWRNEFTA